MRAAAAMYRSADEVNRAKLSLPFIFGREYHSIRSGYSLPMDAGSRRSIDIPN
jgi:hypothetical protein